MYDSTIITIGGYDLPADLLDADFADRLSAGLDAIMAAMTAFRGRRPDATTSMGDLLRQECAAVDACIDGIWGAGTSAQIFTSSGNARARLDAMQAIADHINASGAALNNAANQGQQRISAVASGFRAPVMPAPVMPAPGKPGRRHTRRHA